MPVATGDAMHAIARLTEANRRNVASDTEAELVQLRLAEGRRRVMEEGGAEPQRIECEDCFHGVTGLPEIDAGALTAESLASGILYHGALLVRGLYGEEQLCRLRQAAANQPGEKQVAAPQLGCSNHTLFELLDVYAESGLLAVVGDYLGGRPLLFGERAKLRRHLPERDRYAAIPWHQDGAFFGGQFYAVNCWSAVTPCGERNPALSVVPHRVDRFYGWNPDEGHAPLDYGRSPSGSAFDRLLSDHPPADCILQPGDAVLFDEMTVHQTLLRPWSCDQQLVTISWFFRPSGFPAWGTPLAV